jgi:adenylosuccinate synthase
MQQDARIPGSLPNVAVVGGQWGDEGKGKVVDLISEHFDVVARFQGGPNAGHTVTIGEMRHAVHHVPSGVFRPSVRLVIGNGTVVALGKLLVSRDGCSSATVRTSSCR